MYPVSFSRFLSLVLLLFLMTWSQWSYAATKYVSTVGNNNNSGDSWALAWRTLQFAADHLVAGDSVWVADGNYTGFNMETSGTAANPIVFITSGNNCVINVHNPTTMDGINVEGADYVEVNGFRAINLPRNGIRLALSDHCIVRNTFCDHNLERGIFTGFTDDLLLEYNQCQFSTNEHGIYVSNSSDRSIIRFNICHHNHGGGIQINADESQGGDGISTDPEIYGNVIYENGVGGGAGINLDGVQSAFIYNNLLYENHASGIALFMQDGAAPSINALVVHNTIVNAADGRWCILAANGSFGAQVYNNILIHENTNPSLPRGSIALDADAVSGFASDYNIVVNKLSKTGDGSFVPLSTWQTYGYDTHSMIAAPEVNIFVAPGTDYHLLTNAQAVNTGNGNFSFGVNTDIEGILRPQGSQVDIGAYEAQGSLAIDEDHVTPKYVPKPEPKIIIGHESLTWPEDLEGKMNILTVEGKLVTRLDISSAGEYSFQSLSPGIYAASISDRNGIQWSTWFVWSGN